MRFDMVDSAIIDDYCQTRVDFEIWTTILHSSKPRLTLFYLSMSVAPQRMYVVLWRPACDLAPGCYDPV